MFLQSIAKGTLSTIADEETKKKIDENFEVSQFEQNIQHLESPLDQVSIQSLVTMATK